MINGKKVLGIIPARGGSKGVLRKNIRNVAGKPLIAWTIEEARKSKYIDRLILSSEDEEIINTAKKFGCDVPFVRPKDLARDDTPGIEPILHAVNKIKGYDYVVLLQPTSPLRIAADIDLCIEKCVIQGAPACVSVTEPFQNPYWMYVIGEGERIQSLINYDKHYLRRQDLPEIYSLNGAIYVAENEWLTKNKSFLSSETICYIMPKERSFDLDTELDLFIITKLMEERLTNLLNGVQQ